MNGCILLSRSLIESEIWKKPPLYLKVWIYLLFKAQYKPYKGLDRGELYVCIKEIQEECSHYSGYRLEKPSKDQIYRIIDYLRRVSGEGNGRDTSTTAGATMITTKKATHGMLIKISNYGKFQDFNYYETNAKNNDGRDNEKATDEIRARKKSNNINEEREERNNITPLNPPRGKCSEKQFEIFWEAYPRKRSKGQARKAFAKVSSEQFDAVMAGLERAKTSYDWQKKNGQYIQYAATWLNAEGWLDETFSQKPKGDNSALGYEQRQYDASELEGLIDEL